MAFKPKKIFATVVVLGVYFSSTLFSKIAKIDKLYAFIRSLSERPPITPLTSRDIAIPEALLRFTNRLWISSVIFNIFIFLVTFSILIVAKSL